MLLQIVSCPMGYHQTTKPRVCTLVMFIGEKETKQKTQNHSDNFRADYIYQRGGKGDCMPASIY